MPKVELLYFPGCPNVEVAREQLRCAFAAIGQPAEWTEIDLTGSTVPDHASGFGSPTILIDCRDVLGASPGDGVSCRIDTDSGMRGVPSLDAFIFALGAKS